MKKSESIAIIILVLSSSYILANISVFAIVNDTSQFRVFANALEFTGTGYPGGAISWGTFDEAFDDFPELKQNHGNYKMAILDSGIDEAVWDEFDNDYGNYLDIHYIDENGDDVAKTSAEDVCSFHHGTVVMSVAIQCLEREECDVYGSIYMFQVAEDDQGAVDPDLVEQQLQWIIDWNEEESAKFKVISMSFGAYYIGQQVCFEDELEELSDEYNCLLIAASGNYVIEDTAYYESEDKPIFPACSEYVFGVGGVFGPAQTTGYNICRMTAQWEEETQGELTTNGLYVGSLYSHLINGNPIDFSERTVDLVTPGFKVEGKCDYFNNDTVINVIATGTSLAVPQVAIAAYLAARKGYYDHSTDYINLDRFFASIYQSSENNDTYRTKTTSEKSNCEYAGIPVANLGTYTKYYSYRVGYGSLDVHDMIEFVEDLS